MNTSTLLLDETHLMEIITEPQMRKRLLNLESKRKISYEKAWDIINTCHDYHGNKTWENCELLLSGIEKEFFKRHSPEKAPIESSVDPNKLLDIRKKVGIKCPQCQEQETTYRLMANRSADEGMTAHCSCRSCSHSWKIRM
jgi:DNA-directed RNA polymerase subunit M/transcription elongation factor TFIIS